MNIFFLTFTNSGVGLAWLIAVAILNVLDLSGINFVEDQKTFMRSFFASLIAWISSILIKKIVARKRPALDTHDSFPSGHAAASSALFYALYFNGHFLARWIGLWAFLVSISRVYLGAHFVTDVVAGIILGALSGCLILL